MLSAFAKGLAQLSDPRTRGLMWRSLFLSIAVFLALWFAVAYTLTHTALFEIAWLETAVDVLGGVAVFVITWLLFPAVVSAVLGVFLDSVADAVERRHYPELPPARDAPLGEIIGSAARFFVVMVVLNIVLLLFLVVPPVFPFVFYGVNGYLLGREYFELVASRRFDSAGVRSLRRTYRTRLWVAGVVIAFLLTIPFVNLLAPVIGTAAMLHLFEMWRRRDAGVAPNDAPQSSTG